MNRRNLLFRAGALAAVVGGAWWARDHLLWPAPRLSFVDGHASKWMPYARRALVPTIRVRIADRVVTALIDSGAQYSVIDRALFAELPPARRSVFDMPLVAYGVGGGAQMGRGVTLALDMPGVFVEGLRAAILDLGPLATTAGLSTPVIIGRDVLGEAVLALDPARRFSRLIRREAFVRPDDLVAAEVRRNGTALVSEITVEGSVLEGVVDTGASSLLALDAQSARAAGLYDGRPRTPGASLVLGGSLRADVIEARTVTFADQLYRQVQVGVFEQPPLPDFPGALIGMEAFAERRVAIDVGRGELHLSRSLDLTVG